MCSPLVQLHAVLALVQFPVVYIMTGDKSAVHAGQTISI